MPTKVKTGKSIRGTEGYNPSVISLGKKGSSSKKETIGGGAEVSVAPKTRYMEAYNSSNVTLFGSSKEQIPQGQPVEAYDPKVISTELV